MSPRDSENAAGLDAVDPVNQVDGIPDRSPRRPWWKYLLLVVVFLAWVAFLIYVQRAGNDSGPGASATSPTESPGAME